MREVDGEGAKGRKGRREGARKGRNEGREGARKGRSEDREGARKGRDEGREGVSEGRDEGREGGSSAGHWLLVPRWRPRRRVKSTGPACPGSLGKRRQATPISVVLVLFGKVLVAGIVLVRP